MRQLHLTMPGGGVRDVLIVGLTGGVASGKTAASDYFARLGVPVVDADVAARQVVEPGEPGLEAVVQAFGSGILDGDGRLDRAALRQRVFTDPQARQTLGEILHPRIRQRLREQLAAAVGPYALLVAPLLIENQMQDMVARILVIDVPESLQRQRVQQRDGSSAAQADSIIASQAGREERLTAADDVICNTGDLEDLYHEIELLHRDYLALAASEEHDTTI